MPPRSWARAGAARTRPIDNSRGRVRGVMAAVMRGGETRIILQSKRKLLGKQALTRFRWTRSWRRRRRRSRSDGASLQARDAAVVVVRELFHEDLVDLQVDLAQHPRLLGVRQERALEAVDDDALHLVGAQPERAHRERHFLRQRRPRNETAVGIQGQPQAMLE